MPRLDLIKSVIVEYLGHGHDEFSERPTDLYLARIPAMTDWRSLSDDPLWREVVEDPESAGSALFIAGDWRDLKSEIGEFALYCLSHGVFWVSTWGPSCEEAHDLFDWSDLEANDFKTTTAMTTWHTDDPLHVAMTLFFSAFPTEGMTAGPARIALSFGVLDWTEALRGVVRHEVDRNSSR